MRHLTEFAKPHANRSSAKSTVTETRQPLIRVVHLTSSRFFGGPERQMLELAQELAPDISTSFVSFSESNHCQTFLTEVRRARFSSIALKHDTPRLLAAVRELRILLAKLQTSVLCVHGYKAGLLGLWAGRQANIPVVAVSRGWTAENWKVRLYERLDRRALRRMDRVVCVSHGQADKVRNAGISHDKISVIHNAIRTARFEGPQDATFRRRLLAMFPKPPRFILGAAGRLSPEKGFDVLIDACKRLRTEVQYSDFGVVLFGEGALRDDLQDRINAAGLAEHFVLAGFTAELDRFMPHFDLFVQSSHTEGLPNVLLEAAAAGVPVVATNVGGTGEVVVDVQTGILVEPNDPKAVASALHQLLINPDRRTAMRAKAPQHVARNFTFAAQAEAYRNVFDMIIRRKPQKT